jgi:hypothetical protein
VSIGTDSQPRTSPRLRDTSPSGGATPLRWYRRGGVLATGLSIALVLPSLVWISLDRSVWPWDPAWYGQVSVDLWATLRLNHGTWPSLMANAFGIKPPGVAWLGQFFVPWGRLIGSIEFSLLLSVVVTMAGTIALTALAAARLSHRPTVAAATAALTIGSAPLFVSMSHEYFADPLQAFAVAWLLYAMASATRWRPALTIATVVAAFALGLLAKVSSPAYVALPGCVALVGAFRARHRSAAGPAYRDKQVVATVVVALALVLGDLGWYSRNLHGALQHAEVAANSTLWGSGAPFGDRLPLWFGRLQDALLLPYFGQAILVVIAIGAASFAVRQRGRRFEGGLYSTLCALACAITVLGIVVVFALQVNDEVRFLLPLIPMVALVSGTVLAGLGTRASAAGVLVLVAQFGLVTAASFGAAAHSLSYARLAAPDRTSLRPALVRIVDRTCTPSAANRISMVGVDYPWLNANTLMMLAAEKYALRGRNCYYTALGLAEQSSARAWQRLEQFKPPYYISVDYERGTSRLPPEIVKSISPRDAFNRIDRDVFERMVRSGQFRAVESSRGSGLVVWESIRNH